MGKQFWHVGAWQPYRGNPMISYSAAATHETMEYKDDI